MNAENPSRKSRLIQLVAGTLLSVVALSYIAFRIDFEGLIRVGKELHWNVFHAIVTAFVLLSVYSILAWRWKILFGGRPSFGLCMRAVVTGYGGNAVLPFRGGDVLRCFFMKRGGVYPLSGTLAMLAVEKLIDTAAVAVLAFLAVTLFGEVVRVSPLSLFVLVALALAVSVVVKLKMNFVLKFLTQRKEKMSRLKKFFEILQTALEEFDSNVSLAVLLKSVSIGLLVWLFLNVFLYGEILATLGIDLDYASLVLLLLFGALSVAIPSAPSGVGIFHASIMSAFEILGYDSETGLLAATAIHLVVNIPVALGALSIYWFSLFTVRTR